MAAFETSRPATGLFGGRLNALIASISDTVVAWNDLRVTRRALSKLSDRELDDIGLTRSDVYALDLTR